MPVCYSRFPKEDDRRKKGRQGEAPNKREEQEEPVRKVFID